jgi:hypothetical protein
VQATTDFDNESARRSSISVFITNLIWVSLKIYIRK